MPEHQNIEYKQSWHNDYLKWGCGFANAIGGMIYIGIDDKGNVVHLADYAKLMEDIPNKIRNSMGIICDVQLEEKEGKNCISIKVNPYSVAVSLRGRYYYRTGSTTMESTGVELNEFLLNKAGKIDLARILRALFFANLEEVWEELRTVYNGDLKKLVYNGNPPESSDVLETMKKIKDRMVKVEWNIFV